MCGAVIRDLYSPEVQGEEVTNVEDNTDIKMVEGMLIQNAPLS